MLLLEAGPDLRARPPAGLRDGWRIPVAPDWGYQAQPDAQGAVEDLTRGRLVGGTSWMTRFALRGASADYDEWAALGNPGWAFEDVLPYFMRCESDADLGDRPWHGDRGPLPITRYPDSSSARSPRPAWTRSRPPALPRSRTTTGQGRLAPGGCR